MSESVEDINIAISFDEGYIAFVYTLINSIFINNPESVISFHAIAPDVPAADKQVLCEFTEKRGGKLRFYEFGSSVITKEFVIPDSTVSGLTIAAYYRIFFARLVSAQLSKLLYIDIDTLVVGDLRSLFQIDLRGFAIGAVKDIEMHVRTDLGIPDSDSYFNSGVLLIDLQQWRTQQITERACEVIAKHSDKIKQWADQDVLNMVFNGQWHRLDCRYNMMKGYVPEALPKKHYKEFLSDKVIIHYNGQLKAWHRTSDSKFRHLYPLYFVRSARATSSGYAARKISVDAIAALLKNRLVEVYFDNPAVGKLWRRLKSTLKAS